MAWCRQATSLYLSQCWPRSMSPNGITRPQWVKPVICPSQTPSRDAPQMEVSASLKCRWVSPHLKNVLASFDLEDKLSHYENQSRGYLMGGGPLWPPTMPRLGARSSQSNPRGSRPEVLKRERGHVTAENLEFQRWGSSGPSSLMLWTVWYKTKFVSQNLATNFGKHLYGLPKLVANISSKFHHLVNTGLAVGSLVKWLPIKVATPANYTQFEWFITRQLEMAPFDCNCL